MKRAWSFLMMKRKYKRWVQDIPYGFGGRLEIHKRLPWPTVHRRFIYYLRDERMGRPNSARRIDFLRRADMVFCKRKVSKVMTGDGFKRYIE